MADKVASRDLAELQNQLGYAFKNRRLLERALTHCSWGADNNQRLEFLGDSVLGCVIGQELFRRDKDFDEGDLTRVRSKLVCEGGLDKVAAPLRLGEYLRMGEGDLRSGGRSRPSVIADAMEAVFGAVFTEAGFDAARDVILALYKPYLETVTLDKDAKTELQELLQGVQMPVPEYRVIGIEGPDHDQEFTCECVVAGLGLKSRGTGHSKRLAEREAAHAALPTVRRLLSERRPAAPRRPHHG